MEVKIEDIYNDGFEVEVEAWKQERAQIKETTPAKSPTKKQREAAQFDFKPQFVTHLPDAEEEAMKSFVLLSENAHQNKQIGQAKQQEDSFICDCKWEPGREARRMACGQDADCINRLTQVECPPDECRCGDHCQNQRIQNRHYAPTRLIKTDKKGYGLMAAADLSADTLIIEYIGEVIAHNNFVRRLRDYSDAGIRHFYFMALQKDEFIDATKKGGRGRFINHSCNPNCYVAKWVVGRRLRLAIFAKRAIQQGEELTFNYNVDRYGHDAQECYCGEPNCVGFIGGKTQTDLGNMDDLYLDALGIADEVEAFGLKGSRKKKGLRLGEDFNPVLKAMVLEDAPKVSSAIRQASSNKRILTLLLDRILLTEDLAVQSQIMRLRGFSLMALLLDEHADDQLGIVGPVLRILKKWPLLTKNKISSTNVESLVSSLATTSTEETVRVLAQDLLNSWSDLDLAYRIPKALKDATDKDGTVDVKRLREDLGETILASKRIHLEEADSAELLTFARNFQIPKVNARKGVEMTQLELARSLGLPLNWGVGSDPQGRPYYYHLQTRASRWTIPTEEEAMRIEKALEKQDESLNDIISRAKAQVDMVAASKLALGASTAASISTTLEDADAEAARAAKRRERKQRRRAKVQASKERRVLKAFSPIVVKALTKYTLGSLGRDQFKRRAKELTSLLVEKEKKRETYATEEYHSLTKNQEERIKAFTKSWASKLLARKGLSSTKRANGPDIGEGALLAASAGADSSGPTAEGVAEDLVAEFDQENDVSSDEEGKREEGEDMAMAPDSATDTSAAISSLPPPPPPPILPAEQLEDAEMVGGM